METVKTHSPNTPATTNVLRTTRPFTYTLRRATLSDAPTMASLAATSYLHSGLSAFLLPGRFAHIVDVTYSYEQRIRSRLASPRNISLIAISDQGLPVGYVQFQRYGEDAAALDLEIEQDTLFLRGVVQPWVSLRAAWDRLWFYDRSVDEGALKVFEAIGGGGWSEEEFRERWYVQSLVVSAGHQRKGVGKALMREVLERTGREGVPVVLEASPDGEKLYRKLGFELLRRFPVQAEGEKEGGLMVWWPQR